MLSLKQIRVLPSLKRFIHIESRKCEKRLPDPWDLMTGMERWVALQYLKGNTDPFFLEPIIRGPGTKECPNVVYSIHDKRIVGCICTKDSMHIEYWWIHENFPRRCKCNHWFVLQRIEIPKMYEDWDF